jgi:arylsulfatase A-like enzyme
MKIFLQVASVIILIAFFNTCAVKDEKARQESGPPNIILFFADDLGYGDLQCYGHPYNKTPNLDRMASMGLKLTSFYVAAPVCSPSRAAIMTGRYPMRTGMHHNTGPGGWRGLPATEITIAEVLKSVGYKTKAIGKWHLGDTREEYLPTSQGFDEYFGLPYSNDMIPPWVKTDIELKFYRNDKKLPDTVDQNTLTVRYTEEALDFIQSAGDDPFFLYMPFSMPHLPLYPAPQFKGKSGNGLYGDVMMSIDWSVGQVLDELERLELAEETLVVFTSDNGPWNQMPPRMLVEGITRWDAGTTNLFRGSKATTFEGGMRVPCIMKWPGKIEAGRISRDLVTSMDLFPTFAKLAGASIPDDRPIDGNDLEDFILNGDPSPTDQLFYFMADRPGAFRDGEWKLNRVLIKGENGENNVKLELFNLLRDPAERINCADEFPEKVKEMEEILLKFNEDLRTEPHYLLKNGR